MEAANGPSTFGLASRIRGDLPSICVLLQENSCQKPMTVPGVGPAISTAMVAAIGKCEAFQRSRDFGVWLGLIPRQYSTGGRPILGRLSKRGSKLGSIQNGSSESEIDQLAEKKWDSWG